MRGAELAFYHLAVTRRTPGAGPDRSVECIGEPVKSPADVARYYYEDSEFVVTDRAVVVRVIGGEIEVGVCELDGLVYDVPAVRRVVDGHVVPVPGVVAGFIPAQHSPRNVGEVAVGHFRIEVPHARRAGVEEPVCEVGDVVGRAWRRIGKLHENDQELARAKDRLRRRSQRCRAQARLGEHHLECPKVLGRL
jgi:hypothetical protein